MQNDITEAERSRHLSLTTPSPWVARFSHLLPENGSALDVAAGGGRHSQFLLKQGLRVTAIDRNEEALGNYPENEKLNAIVFDMETGVSPFSSAGPLFDQTFDVIVVVNYLYRDLSQELLAALKPGGVFIYETFALGNEEFARPRNPDHLLKSGELLDWVSDKLQIVAYEHGLVQTTDIPGVKQRLCAVNDLHLSIRADGQPAPHKIS